MSLEPGQKLHQYEVVELIGKGGMGEVYRARDTELGRDVAIKVLPDAVAGEPLRLERFEREARLLAQLNHPRIATLYGLQRDGESPLLVMELVEGQTLAERLGGGPVPIDESLRLLRQLAEALEAAHERGVLHRDLKPANIKISPDGDVKVLDFGLAKAIGGEFAEAGSPELSQSPTMSQRTVEGVILGTAAYMSPEQAKGKKLDRRTDIWAFGVVAFELLTGKRAFAGEDVSETLAGILKLEPAWEQLPAETPVGLRRLLKR